MNTNSPIADTGGDLTVEVEYIDRGSSGEIVDLVTGRWTYLRRHRERTRPPTTDRSGHDNPFVRNTLNGYILRSGYYRLYSYRFFSSSG